MARKDRPHRSELAVPGTNVRAMAKAPTLGADIVFLDLEDAVAPDDKEQARANVIDALLAQDWTRCAVSVRVNGLDTHWCYRDVVEVVEQAGDVLDTVLVPKVGSPSDVEFVATLLDQIEQRNGWPRRPDRHPHPDRDRRRAWRTSRRSRVPDPTGSRRWCSAWPTTPRACARARRTSAARTPTTRC